MTKTILLVVAGLAAGFAVAHWLSGGPQAEASSASPSPVAAPPPAAGDVPARIVELESALRAEVEQRTALERRVTALDAELDELHAGAAQNGAARPTDASRQDAAQTEPDAGGAPGFARRFRGPASTEQRVEQLVSAGFAPDRAAWIEKRTAELQMQAIQAQYAARRGENVDPALLRGGDQTLRQELGDAEYERYLTALGRPTKVGVFNVIASSPAEQAGLKSGDQIVSYAGTRVFDMRELNELTLQGSPGQPVAVEIQREGQTVQLVLPRGPIGIGGGPFAGGRPGR
jgi:membrane-associated protease RseP (regulator of RpoE activity)